jgi:hypothetical protein
MSRFVQADLSNLPKSLREFNKALHQEFRSMAHIGKADTVSYTSLLTAPQLGLFLARTVGFRLIAEGIRKRNEAKTSR